jgi:hypothetical protein
MKNEHIYAIWGIYPNEEPEVTATILSIHRNKKNAEKWLKENCCSGWVYTYPVKD